MGQAIPNDASPQEGEDDIEKQWPPYDKVVDPRPVMCVQGKLKHVDTVRNVKIQLVKLTPVGHITRVWEMHYL